MRPFNVWCPEWGQDSVRDAETVYALGYTHAAVAYLERWDGDGDWATKRKSMVLHVRDEGDSNVRAITVTGAGLKPAYVVTE